MQRLIYTGPRVIPRGHPDRKAWMALRAEYPDAYRVLGLGWAGPGWAELTKRERELLQKHES